MLIKDIRTGQTKEVAERFGRILVKTPRYTTASLESQDGQAISPRTGKPKRQYKRRDMTAQRPDAEEE